MNNGETIIELEHLVLCAENRARIQQHINAMPQFQVLQAVPRFRPPEDDEQQEPYCLNCESAPCECDEPGMPEHDYDPQHGYGRP